MFTPDSAEKGEAFLGGGSTVFLKSPAKYGLGVVLVRVKRGVVG